MRSKVLAFFKGFFRNMKADPVSSTKGVMQLAAAGATCYGMAMGNLSPEVGAPIAASFATQGVHALGTDLTAPGSNLAVGTEIPATVIVPAAMSIVEQVAALKKDAEDGQKKIDTFKVVNDAIGNLVK